MKHPSQTPQPSPARWLAPVVIACVLGLAAGCSFDTTGYSHHESDGAPILDAGPRDAADWDALGVDLCDRDQDGYQALSCGGTDCDDHDAEAWPERPELCDGKDNDCDGEIDEGLPGAVDQDGDGYSACVGDCDDADPAVYPFAPELCDGKDNDCDGDTDGDADCDGDGYPSRDGDCDDADPAVYPFAPERCDGKDNDCDTIVDEDCI